MLQAVLAAILAVGPAHSLATGELAALARLEPGRWQMRNSDSGEVLRSLCLGDPLGLMQPEHIGQRCTREIVGSDANGGTLHYTCAGRGFGQTSLRVETSRLATLDTQGIANNRPFAYHVEARHAGRC